MVPGRMSSLPAARVYDLAARDLVVAIAARDDFPSFLDAFAKRRGALYAHPERHPDEAAYWPGVAAALSPIAPPEAMPMAGLIAAGVTLEGGARGLRALFTSAPSEKDRKRVQRIASLAARVMEVVAGADDTLSDDERRGIAMAMASFGLDDEALAATQPPSKMKAEQLDVFGELDARVRRELVRGAWQLCLRAVPTEAERTTVREVAARLEMSPEVDALYDAVRETLSRVGVTATLAVELARVAGESLAPEVFGRAMERLIQAAATPAIAPALRARVTSKAPGDYAAAAGTTRAQRLQAVALAWATLIGTDPSYSMGLHLRGELSAAAAEAGAAYEVGEALDTVDRYLHQRLREVTLATHPAPAASAP
jgi:hypothetical protein